MFDEVFGEVTFDCGYTARREIAFFGENREIEILIDADEGEEISQLQRDAFEALMHNWEEMQQKTAAAILCYYNEREKGAYGPDDPIEFAKWWPDIESIEEMGRKIHLDAVVIPSEYTMEGKGEHPVYLLFSREWGGEDTEDNGVAVLIEGGEVTEVDYKYIAF